MHLWLLYKDVIFHIYQISCILIVSWQFRESQLDLECFDFVFLFKIWLGRRQAFWESLLLRWDHPDFYSPCGQVYTAWTFSLQYCTFYNDTWTNAQTLKKHEAIIITVKSSVYHCAELFQYEHTNEFISAKGTSIILRCWKHKNPLTFFLQFKMGKCFFFCHVLKCHNSVPKLSLTSPRMDSI